MFAPFILFTEGLSADKIGVDKGDLVGVLHRKINILGVAQRNFVVVGILQRHLVAAKMRKDVVTAIFPGAGSVEDIGQLVYQRRFAAGLTAENRDSTHEERLHLGRNVIPVAERILTNLRAADIHKRPLRVHQHGLNAKVFKILRRI